MTPITFVHAADLHLDSPFQNKQSLDEGWKTKLKESTWKALDDLVHLAVGMQVDFLIISGDIFDKESYSVKAKVRFYKSIQRLAELHIHTYIIHGNHDPLLESSSLDFINIAQNPYIHVFPANEVGCFSHYKNGVEVARLYGRSYWQRHVSDNLASQYIAKEAMELPEDNITKGLLKIAVLHGQVGTETGLVPYAPFSLAEIKASNIHYWAMGHIHKKNIVHNQAPFVVYPGNAQGRHTGEMGERGCYLVNWIDSQQVDITFQSLEAIRWEEITVPVDNLVENGKKITLSSVIDSISAYIQQYISGVDKPHIVKLILTGQTSAYLEMRKQGILDVVMEELTTDNLLVIDSINKTLPMVDLESLRNQKTLLGEFLTLLQKVRTDPEAYKELAEELAELYGHPKFQQVTNTKQGQVGKEQWKLQKLEKDLLSWLDEVEQIGLDLFFCAEENRDNISVEHVGDGQL